MERKTKQSIFLSHSYIDKPFARRIGRDLQEQGISVWIDEAEILVGDSLVEKITSAIDHIDYVGAILSKNSVQSKWVQFELKKAMIAEIESGVIKVLPIVIDDCELPSFLEGKLFADFRTLESYGNGLDAIFRRLSPGSAGVPLRAAPRYFEDEDAVFSKITTEYASEISGLGIAVRDLYSLRRNALLSLLVRCSERMKSVLFANWHHSSYPEIGGQIAQVVLPSLINVVGYPSDPARNNTLNAAKRIMNDGMHDYLWNLTKIARPMAVKYGLDIITNTLRVGLGESEFAPNVLYETYLIFMLIDNKDTVIKKILNADFEKIRSAIVQYKWTDDSPINHEQFWGWMWEEGQPAFYNEKMNQRKSLTKRLADLLG